MKLYPIFVLCLIGILAIYSPARAQSALTNGGNHDSQISIAGEVDLWTFTAQAGDIIHLRVTETSGGTAFAPRLRIHDAGNIQVGYALSSTTSSTSSARIELVPEASGAFSVRVDAASATATGGYRINFLRLPGAVATPAGDNGGALINGGRYDGTINVGDLDVWSFTAETGDVVDLRLSQESGTSAFTPRFRVFDAAGGLVSEVMGANVSNSEARLSFQPPGDGEYQVVVDAGSEEGTGQYRLFYLRLPGTFTIPVGDDGDVLVNGGSSDGAITAGDVDPWTFVTEAGRVVQLRTGELSGGSGFAPRLRVYDATGALIGWSAGAGGSSVSEARLTLTPTLAGTYTAVVDSDLVTGAGTYRIHYLELPGPPVVPVADEGGPLTSGNNHDGNVSLGDLDGWTLAASANDRVTFTLTKLTGGSSFAPRLTLYSSAGERVGRTFDAASTPSSSLSLIAILPEEGEYLAVVDSESIGGAGNYRLSFIRETGPFSYPPGTGEALANGGNHEGSLALGEEDHWTLEALAGEQLLLRAARLTGNTSWFRPWVRLFGPDGVLIASGDTGDDDNGVTVVARVTGTYTVAVSSYFEDYDGTYQLHYMNVSAAFTVPGGDDGGEIVNGDNREGTLSMGDLDAWTLTAAAGERLLVRATRLTGNTNWFRPWVRLYGPDGLLLGSGDSGNHDNSVEVVAPVDGAYTVVMSSYYAGYDGTYRLHFLKAPEAFIVPENDDGGPLESGVRHDGEITMGDLDGWRLTALAGERVLLRAARLTGNISWFQPWVRLYGPDGLLVAAGDTGEHDNGVNVVAPVSGIYTVVMSSYYAGYDGTYRLQYLKLPGEFIVPPTEDGGPLANGDNYNGALPFGDMDTWTLTAAPGERVLLRAARLTGNVSWFQPWVRLYGPDGSLVAAGDTGEHDNTVNVVAPVGGTYTVVMSSYYAGYDGTYLLNVLKIPGTVAIPSGDEGGLLASNGSFFGAITIGDMDAWTIAVEEGEQVLVRAARLTGNTSWFQPWVRLYGPDGSLLASGDASEHDNGVYVRAAVSGNYTVVVTSYYAGYNGTYILHALKLPGGSETPMGDEGGTLSNGGHHDGALSLADMDSWTFHAVPGEFLFVSLAELTGGNTFSPWLRLYGPDGALKKTQEHATAASFDFRTDVAGNYTVVVAGGNPGDAGTYRLRFAKAVVDPVIPEGEDGGPLTNGMTHDGSTELGDFDLWTLNVVAGESLVFVATENVTGSAHQPWLRLYSPSGVLAASASSNGAWALLSHRTTSSGLYSLVVSSTSLTGDGGYRLSFANLARTFVVAPDDQGGAVSLGTVPTGTITRGDLDPWTFWAAAGDDLSIVVQELVDHDNFVPIALLYTPAGTLVSGIAGNQSATLAHKATDSGRYSVLIMDNNAVASGSYRLTVTGYSGHPSAIQLGGITNGRFTTTGQRALYELEVPPGGHFRVALDDLDNIGASEVYVRRGGVPTAGAFDYRFSRNGADQELLVPNAGAGTWYVLIIGANVPAGGSNFTLNVEFLAGAILGSLNPNRVGNTAPAVIAVDGAGFTSASQASLKSGAATVVAGQSVVVSGEKLNAHLDVTGLAAGTYELTITQGNTTTSLPLEIVEGGLPRLETNLIVPGRVGRHALATVFVEYANTGDVAMPAPLLVLRGSDDALLTMDSSLAAQGLWTSTKPKGFGDTVQILASGATPGTLQPGERKRVPVMYVGLLAPWDFSDDDVQFDLGVFDGSNMSAIDWSAYKDQLRPPGISPESWEAVWANFVSAVGPTWGDYSDMLAENAVYLGQLGLNISDIGELLAFEIAQAEGMNPVGPLASTTDAAGVNLAFSRVFSNSLSQRLRLGPLGFGWSHSWDFRIEKDAGGNVAVIGPAGARREFQPDVRGGFFSQAGDHGKLADLGGAGYELRETAGGRMVFRTDGRLDYVEDLNSNRVTAIWSGALLMRLEHSSGESLTFSYTGNLLQSVADSFGGETLYSYDSVQNLVAAAYDGATIVAYTYVAGQGAAREHALSAVIYPGGTRDEFAYDERGRLLSMSRGCCAEKLTFAYDAVGTVALTDALTNQSKVFFDHRGLRAKVENPLGGAVRYGFDRNFNLTSLHGPDGESSTFSVDARGNVTRMLDAAGQAIDRSYTSYARLGELTDARGQATRFEYDTSGNTTGMIYPDGSRESYGYNTRGELVSLTNRRNQSTTFIRDSFGRVTRKETHEGRTFDYVYDSRGHLTEIVDSLLGTNHLTFDSRDRLSGLTYHDGKGFTFEYDDAGRRTARTSHDGYTLRYLYDDPGRLSRLEDGSGHVIVEYLYDQAGRLNRENKGNGTWTTYQYDAAGQVVQVVNRGVDGAVLSEFNYSYNAGGGRDAIETRDWVTSYAYDEIDQLVEVTYADGHVTGLTYDEAGNRKAVVADSAEITYTTNSLNQYSQVGDTTYSYDASGNLTSRNGIASSRSYEYDSENRLTKVSAQGGEVVAQYVYDAFGNRIRVTDADGSARFVHDPTGLGNMVAEFDEGGALVARYDHGHGLTRRIAVDGTGAWYGFDALGNTSEVSSEDGAVLNAYTYDADGQVVSSAIAVDNPFQFVGRMGGLSDGDGMVYMRSRMYAPQLGRFMSEDLLRFSDSLANGYRYAENNPVLLVDPKGTQARIYTPREYGDSGTCPKNEPSGLDNWIPAPAKYHDGRPVYKEKRKPGQQWTAECDYIDGVLPEKTDQFSGSANRHGGDPWWDPTGWSDWWKHAVDDPGGPQWFGPVSVMPEPPSDDANSSQSGTSASSDPNELIGPAGYGSANFLSGVGTYAYRIGFENDKDATASAQVVEITNVIPANLNLDTLEFTSAGFGDWVFPIASGSQNFEHTEALTMQGMNVEVTIEVRIDRATREVRARFSTLMPESGLPPPVEVGFLPPENGTGRGMGHVGYVVQPVLGLTTGTEIRNIGFITFDRLAGGPTFRTDLSDLHDPNSPPSPDRQALVTIDSDGPSSSVQALATSTTSDLFPVSWLGTDVGAGISSYDIYVRTGGGSWLLWLENTPETTADFRGEYGRSYGFISVAQDGAGHGEIPPAGGTPADASTTLVAGPRITAHPTSVQTQAGQTTTLSVTAEGPAGLTYQWQRDGVIIEGATGPTLTISSSQRFHGGNYTVVVTVGGLATTSQAAIVEVDLPPSSAARLLNLSTRGLAGAGANQLFPGFVISGTGTKKLLIRAVGPSLGDLAPSLTVLPDPRLELKRFNFTTSLYEDIQSNDNWETNANAAEIVATGEQVFAFPFTDSADAALLVDLPAGQYAVIGGDKDGTSAIGIVELYDADPGNPSTSLVNISNRGFAGVGDEVMIPGFVVSSEGPKTFLIRVVGPTLAGYGVPGTMSDPKLIVFRTNPVDGQSTEILSNDNWSEDANQAADTIAVAAEVSAFALAAGSADAAFVVTLEPGVYSVVGSSIDSEGTGIVLVEIYVVP